MEVRCWGCLIVESVCVCFGFPVEEKRGGGGTKCFCLSWWFVTPPPGSDGGSRLWRDKRWGFKSDSSSLSEEVFISTHTHTVEPCTKHISLLKHLTLCFLWFLMSYFPKTGERKSTSGVKLFHQFPLELCVKSCWFQQKFHISTVFSAFFFFNDHISSCSPLLWWFNSSDWRIGTTF